MVEVRSHQSCRHYDLILSKEEMEKHHVLMHGFILRDILSPRGGSSGPEVVDMKVVKGKYRYVFWLNEQVCDEYEKAMGITKACRGMREFYNG